MAGSAENLIRWRGVEAAAIPEFSSSVSAIAAATCVRKMADSSARNPSGVASELSSYSPQFVQISKVAYFFLATCCEECQRLSDRKQLSSSNLQYMLRRLATDRAVVVLPHAGKLQRFHRLSTGSGTRVVVLAEPHVFAPEQPPTIPGAVQLRLPSTRTVWNSSGRPCEWCRLARCAACG